MGCFSTRTALPMNSTVSAAGSDTSGGRCSTGATCGVARQDAGGDAQRQSGRRQAWTRAVPRPTSKPACHSSGSKSSMGPASRASGPRRSGEGDVAPLALPPLPPATRVRWMKNSPARSSSRPWTSHDSSCFKRTWRQCHSRRCAHDCSAGTPLCARAASRCMMAAPTAPRTSTSPTIAAVSGSSTSNSSRNCCSASSGGAAPPVCARCASTRSTAPRYTSSSSDTPLARARR